MERVLRVDEHFVSDECVRVNVPYCDNLALFSTTEMLYQHKVGSKVSVHKFLTDERAKEFPYSNIPSYKSRSGIFRINNVSHLYEFNKPYVRLFDRHLIEAEAYKDGSYALIREKEMDSLSHTVYLGRSQLDELFISKSGNLYVMGLDGEIYEGYSSSQFLMPEEAILRYYKKNAREAIGHYRELGKGKFFDEDILNYFEKSIDNMKIEDVPSNSQIAYDNFFIIETTGEDIKIKSVCIRFMGPNNYKVVLTHYPTTKTTLEHLKTMAIHTERQPKINLRLNKQIDKEDVLKAEAMVKSYYSNKRLQN